MKDVEILIRLTYYLSLRNYNEEKSLILKKKLKNSHVKTIKSRIQDKQLYH